MIYALLDIETFEICEGKKIRMFGSEGWLVHTGLICDANWFKRKFIVLGEL